MKFCILSEEIEQTKKTDCLNFVEIIKLDFQELLNTVHTK